MISDALLIEVENYDDNETNKHIFGVLGSYLYLYTYISDYLDLMFLLQSLRK